MDSIQTEETLRQRATAVREELEQLGYERPIFIEFSGSPKSGKSTCIDIVAHFFRRTNFRILAPTEGASKRTPYFLKDDLVAFNAWSACYALEHILEGQHHSDRYHIAILDRGLFDALVWFDLLSANPHLIQNGFTSQDCDKIHDFLLMRKWRSVIDCVFLFRADPETSMERENRDKIIDDPGRAMNPEFLRILNESYERVRNKHGIMFKNFEFIDTSVSTQSTQKSTALHVVDKIISIFER